MDFIIDLLVLINRKDKSNNFILVIIYCLIKMIYYKLIKVIINILGLAKVFINEIVYYYHISI